MIILSRHINLRQENQIVLLNLMRLIYNLSKKTDLFIWYRFNTSCLATKDEKTYILFFIYTVMKSATSVWDYISCEHLDQGVEVVEISLPNTWLSSSNR